TLDAQCNEIATALRNQLRVFKNELLAVLCPRREDLNEVWERLQLETDLQQRLCKIDEDKDPFNPSRPICVSTIHGAKGLEVRAMHLASAENVKRVRYQRNVVFTAVTRAQ